MLKTIRPIEGEVEAFIINNQSQIVAVNKPGRRGYVQIGYLEDEKKFIVIFVPLEVLLSSEHQEAIATNGGFVQQMLQESKNVQSRNANCSWLPGARSRNLLCNC